METNVVGDVRPFINGGWGGFVVLGHEGMKSACVIWRLAVTAASAIVDIVRFHYKVCYKSCFLLIFIHVL